MFEDVFGTVVQVPGFGKGGSVSGKSILDFFSVESLFWSHGVKLVDSVFKINNEFPIHITSPVSIIEGRVLLLFHLLLSGNLSFPCEFSFDVLEQPGDFLGFTFGEFPFLVEFFPDFVESFIDVFIILILVGLPGFFDFSGEGVSKCLVSGQFLYVLV
jgi:hypothetical protein